MNTKHLIESLKLIKNAVSIPETAQYRLDNLIERLTKEDQATDDPLMSKDAWHDLRILCAEMAGCVAGLAMSRIIYSTDGQKRIDELRDLTLSLGGSRFGMRLRGLMQRYFNVDPFHIVVEAPELTAPRTGKTSAMIEIEALKRQLGILKAEGRERGVMGRRREVRVESLHRKVDAVIEAIGGAIWRTQQGHARGLALLSTEHLENLLAWPSTSEPVREKVASELERRLIDTKFREDAAAEAAKLAKAAKKRSTRKKAKK